MPDSSAFKAGLFIVLMTLAGAALVVIVGGGVHPFGAGKTYTVTFGPGADLSGMVADAPVRVLGVAAGKVERVDVGVDAGGEVEARVVIRLPDRITLGQDAEVVAGSSLTGAVWINVARAGSGPEATADTPLRGSVASIGSLLARAETLVPRVEQTLETFRDVADGAGGTLAGVDEAVVEMRAALAEVKGPLQETLAEARTLAGSLNESVPPAMEGVTSLVEKRLPETLEGVDGMTAAARETMADAREALAGVRAAVDDARLAMKKVGPALDRVTEAGGDASEVVRRVGRLVDAARPKLLAAVDDVGDAAAGLDGAVGELRASPWRLLYKPKKSDQERLALYAVAREYAEGARDLERAAEALSAAGAERDGAAAQDLQDLHGLIVAAYDRFADVQARLFDQID